MSPLPPVVIGGVLVVPMGLIALMTDKPLPGPKIPVDTQAVAAKAREIVMQAERELGLEPIDREMEKIGYDIVTEALKAPTRQIVDNSGDQGDVVVAQLLEKLQKQDNIGYDANSGKFVDMFKAGIIDPAKVARTALQSAASVAGLMLTTNVLVTDLKDKDKDKEPIPGSVR